MSVFSTALAGSRESHAAFPRLKMRPAAGSPCNVSLRVYKDDQPSGEGLLNGSVWRMLFLVTFEIRASFVVGVREGQELNASLLGF